MNTDREFDEIYEEFTRECDSLLEEYDGVRDWSYETRFGNLVAEFERLYGEDWLY